MDNHRVCIISVADKRHMTMVSMFTNYFKNRGICYDIIRTGRYGENLGRTMSDILDDTSLKVLGKEFVYEIKQSTGVKKYKKIKKYLEFRCEALKIIKNKNYDFFVVWNENTGLLFSDILSKRKFCLCIRDEYKSIFFRRWINHVMRNSVFWTCPCLLGHKYTAEDKKIMCYNRDYNLLKLISPKNNFNKKIPIRITFLGLYHAAPETFKRTCDAFLNDERFILQFFGDGFDTLLREYANSISMNNIITKGAFSYEKTAEYLEQTDIINSYYNVDTVKYAAGIKESYTPMLYIPGIVDESFWGDISKKYGFSYVIKQHELDKTPDRLYKWYKELDFEEFKRGCNEFNKIIDSTTASLYEILDHKLF